MAKSEKGKSVVGLSQAVSKGQKEATDEVVQERIGRQAQQAVKEYFRSITEDNGQATPAPQTDQPAPPAPAAPPAQPQQ